MFSFEDLDGVLDCFDCLEQVISQLVFIQCLSGFLSFIKPLMLFIIHGLINVDVLQS